MARSLGPSGTISFYDDNSNYRNAVINGIKDAKSSGKEMAEVNVIAVSTDNKPREYDENDKLAALKGWLLKNGHKEEAVNVNAIIIEASQNFDDEELNIPIKSILKLKDKLKGSGALKVHPPSEEDLYIEGREHGPEHLRRWFKIMQGKAVTSPDWNRKKMAIKDLNKMIDEFKLKDYGVEGIYEENFDKTFELSELINKREFAEDIVGKIKAMNSGNIIHVPVSSSDVFGAIGDWKPPEGFDFLINNSFHVTVISPQTVANFKLSLGDTEYNNLRADIEKIKAPNPILSKDIGLAARASKQTFALAVKNQEEFKEYRDDIVEKISDALRPLGRKVNPMNWWFERAAPDIDRFFHVSIANDGGGWPTSSVADIRGSDF